MADPIRQVPPLPKNETELTNALTSLVRAVTGIGPGLVRPRWQENPPAQPAFETNWVGLGVVETRSEANHYLAGTPEGDRALYTKWAQLDVLASFYGPESGELAEILRDGLDIDSNRWSLAPAGLVFVAATDIRRVPELVNQRWLQRSDMTITFRRHTDRVYPISSFVEAPFTVTQSEI